MITVRSTLALVLTLAAVFTLPAPARAEAPPPKRSLEWNPRWPTVQWWEYGATAALGLGLYYYEKHNVPPARPHWEGGVLFDDQLRSWLRAESPGGRARAQKISDVLWLSGSLYPAVVDLPVALLVHRNPKVAWQLAMMDLEASALAGFVNRVLEFETGRARPSADRCASDRRYDELCGSTANNASFPSGHTIGIATAAGLTCVHHRYLPLYGHPIADAGACLLLTTATAVTATSRVIADRHHATDVLMGAGLGFGIGYGLPWLLHYRHGASSATRAEARPLALPWVSGDAVGIAMVGRM